jgi:hypothetical protein
MESDESLVEIDPTAEMAEATQNEAVGQQTSEAEYESQITTTATSHQQQKQLSKQKKSKIGKSARVAQPNPPTPQSTKPKDKDKDTTASTTTTTTASTLARIRRMALGAQVQAKKKIKLTPLKRLGLDQEGNEVEGEVELEDDEEQKEEEEEEKAQDLEASKGTSESEEAQSHIPGACPKFYSFQHYFSPQKQQQSAASRAFPEWYKRRRVDELDSNEFEFSQEQYEILMAMKTNQEKRKRTAASSTLLSASTPAAASSSSSPSAFPRGQVDLSTFRFKNTNLPPPFPFTSRTYSTPRARMPWSNAGFLPPPPPPLPLCARPPYVKSTTATTTASSASAGAYGSGMYSGLAFGDSFPEAIRSMIIPAQNKRGPEEMRYFFGVHPFGVVRKTLWVSFQRQMKEEGVWKYKGGVNIPLTKIPATMRILKEFVDNYEKELNENLDYDFSLYQNPWHHLEALANEEPETQGTGADTANFDPDAEATIFLNADQSSQTQTKEKDKDKEEEEEGDKEEWKEGNRKGKTKAATKSKL